MGDGGPLFCPLFLVLQSPYTKNSLRVLILLFLWCVEGGDFLEDGSRHFTFHGKKNFIKKIQKSISLLLLLCALSSARTKKKTFNNKKKKRRRTQAILLLLL